MHDDNTIARSLHDVGLAAWFGGSLMGAVGLNGAAGQVKDPAERATISSEGWKQWVPWNLAAVAAHVAGGVLLTSANRRRTVAQSGVASTQVLKAGLTAAALGVTAYSRYVGRRIQEAGAVPVVDPTRPGDETPPEMARWQRQERVLQWAVPALTGALVVIGAKMGEQQRPVQVLTGTVDRLIHSAGPGVDRLVHAASPGVDRLVHAAGPGVDRLVHSAAPAVDRLLSAADRG